MDSIEQIEIKEDTYTDKYVIVIQERYVPIKQGRQVNMKQGKYFISSHIDKDDNWIDIKTREGTLTLTSTDVSLLIQTADRDSFIWLCEELFNKAQEIRRDRQQKYGLIRR